MKRRAARDHQRKDLTLRVLLLLKIAYLVWGLKDREPEIYKNKC